MPTDPTTPTTEAGIIPCTLCGEPHVRRWSGDRREPASWAADDGHSYVHMGTEDAMEWAAAQARADERRRLAGLVEGLERYEALSPLVYAVTDRGSAIDRAAVLALFSDTEPAP